MKSVSQTVWIVGALLLLAIVIGLLAYWFFILGGQVGGQLSQAQCQLRLQTACKTWADSNFGTIRDVKVLVRPGEAHPCDSSVKNTNTIFSVWLTADCSPTTYWNDVVAPGCRQNYGIELDTRSCGTAGGTPTAGAGGTPEAVPGFG